MNDRTERFLRDALAEALALQQDLTGKQLSTFRTSRSLQRIAERSLEVIGEAIRRALDGNQELEYQRSDLREWIALRNVISHQYDDLLVEIIWEASTEELAALIDELEAMLSHTDHQ